MAARYQRIMSSFVTRLASTQKDGYSFQPPAAVKRRTSSCNTTGAPTTTAVVTVSPEVTVAIAIGPNSQSVLARQTSHCPVLAAAVHKAGPRVQ